MCDEKSLRSPLADREYEISALIEPSKWTDVGAERMDHNLCHRAFILRDALDEEERCEYFHRPGVRAIGRQKRLYPAASR